MSTYLTPAELGEHLGATEENVLRWRRQYGWPSLKIGNHIRFSPEHVQQIEALHEAKADTEAAGLEVLIDGQTSRSRGRSA